MRNSIFLVTIFLILIDKDDKRFFKFFCSRLPCVFSRNCIICR